MSRFPQPGGSPLRRPLRSPTSPGGSSSRTRHCRPWCARRSRTTRTSRIATASVDQAFAQYGITRSALAPQVDAGTAAARQRLSGSAGPAPVPSGRETFNDYSVNLSASYELDVWGRLRRATESARASLLGSEEGRRTVVLTLVSAVADGYIQLRALDRQLEIAQRTSQSLGEAARLQQVALPRKAPCRRANYRQAESQYETAAAQVPELERQVAQQENFINVLLAGIPAPSSGGEISTRCFSLWCPARCQPLSWNAGPTSARPSKI